MADHSRWLAVWLSITTLLCALTWGYSRYSLTQSVSQQLQEVLPSRLEEALHNRFNDERLFHLISQQINADLARLPLTGPLPLLSECQAQVVQLFNQDNQGNVQAAQIHLQWPLAGKTQHTLLSLDCQTNWTTLVVSQSVFGLLLTILVVCLPRPLNKNGRYWQQRLQAMGLSPRRARRFAVNTEHFSAQQNQFLELLLRRQEWQSTLDWLARPDLIELNNQQLQWFQLALTATCCIDTALAIASSEDGLHFDLRNHSLTVHGLPISLGKTPFFYYLWYARLRLTGDGWQLNPAVTRPDHHAATSLIELMEKYGGHAKAINDLKENGLRGKILDQNRNKIKDDLIAQLGESLARQYLFETERDMKTSRYRYRLMLPAEHLTFSGE